MKNLKKHQKLYKLTSKNCMKLLSDEKKNK